MLSENLKHHRKLTLNGLELDTMAPSTSPQIYTGLIYSTEKDNELFGVIMNSVEILETGLSPLGLGKRKMHLFWRKSMT